MFKLKIDLNNAAFDEDTTLELGRILDVVRRQVCDNNSDGEIVMDINGNKVGEWSIV